MENKSDFAYQQIKNKIISGKILPLSEISEEQLQKELNISRTPIREAIQKLAKEHFVMIYPRRGTIVSDITLDLINSVYEIRLLNEPFMARCACRYISEAWISRMFSAFSADLNGKKEEKQRDYFIDLDRELHNMLTSYSNNFLLRDLFRVVNDHNHRIRIFTSQRNRNYQTSIDEHLGILEALQQRDEELVGQRVKEHILTGKRDAFEYY